MSIPVLTNKQVVALGKVISALNNLGEGAYPGDTKTLNQQVKDARQALKTVRELNKVAARINGTKEVMKEVV